MAAAGTDGQRRFKAEGMGIGNDAPSRTRRKGRYAYFFHKFDKFLFRIGIPDAAAGNHDRILGRLEQIDYLPGIFPIDGLGIDVVCIFLTMAGSTVALRTLQGSSR